MGKTRRRTKVSPTLGPGKFEAALKRCVLEHDAWLEPKPHQNFAWFIAMLHIWLERETPNLNLDQVSVRRQNRLHEMSQKVLQRLFTVLERNKRTTRPESIETWIPKLIPDEATQLLFKIALRLECDRYLSHELWNRESAAPVTSEPRVHREPYRDRASLPDPDSPAWAHVNRNPSPKVQMLVRVEPEIKAMIKNAAKAFRMSQTAWFEMTITEQLNSQGFKVPLRWTYRWQRPKAVTGNRTHRARSPASNRDRGASAEHSEKSITVRVSTELASAIERTKGGVRSRSEWFNLAVGAYLDSGDALPGPDTARLSLTEVCSLRFEREFFAQIEVSVRKSGLTNSEWFRRVARWGLEELRKI